MKTVYLDYNATTPTNKDVLIEMLPYFDYHFGNPSSIHTLGQKCTHAIDDARLRISRLISANPDEIIFTGSGTEANNLALLGTAFSKMHKGSHIISTQIEHSSVYETCKMLEKHEITISFVSPDDNGTINPREIESKITDKTFLISVMTANNETGAIQNIKEISKIAGNNSIIMHTDAVQAAGKMPLNVNELDVDLLTLSAHKIYGPKGVGALYVKRGIRLSPLIFGGGQEKKIRAGTENVPGIVGFGKAAEITAQNLNENILHYTRIRDYFEDLILSKIKTASINSENTMRVPNTSNISFNEQENEKLLVKLDLKGICVSSGSACGASSREPSRILKSMNLPSSKLYGSIRFSFGLNTTFEDINYTISVLEKILNK